MTNNTRQLRSRITAVETAVSITQAMKSVSSLRLKNCREALSQARVFYEYQTEPFALAPSRLVDDALRRIAGRNDAEAHDILIVVVSSDRGLAGPYNANIARAALAEGSKWHRPTFLCLGSKLRNALESRRLSIFQQLSAVENIDTKVARHVALAALEAWTVAGTRSVIAFTKFVSSVEHLPELLPLIPPKPGDATSSLRESIWEPSAEDAVRLMLPEIVFGAVSLALAESLASETAARVLAMDQATHKAEEILEHLRCQYHRHRRERITRELVEAAGRGQS